MLVLTTWLGRAPLLARLARRAIAAVARLFARLQRHLWPEAETGGSRVRAVGDTHTECRAGHLDYLQGIRARAPPGLRLRGVRTATGALSRLTSHISGSGSEER